MVIKHPVSIDSNKFQSKPGKEFAGSISQNLGSSSTDRDLTIDELMDMVVQPNGQSWCPAIFKNEERKKENWIAQGFIALDFDYEDENDSDPKKAKKGKEEIEAKRKLFGDEYKPNLTIEQVLERCKLYNIEPCAIHTSFSSNSENNKFRVIFQLYETNTNPKIAKCLIYLFYLMFPESDRSCSTDISRFFFGGRDIIYKNYTKVLDVANLCSGSVKHIKDVYGDDIYNNNIRKEMNHRINLNKCYLSSGTEIPTGDYLPCATNDNKFYNMVFEFGDLEDSMMHGFVKPESETVMSEWDIERIVKALDWVSPETYQTWVEVALSLKNSYGDAAKDIWKEWSKKATNASDEYELDEKWDRGIKPDGSKTVASIFEMAKRNGYDPIPDTVKNLNKKYFHHINENGNEVIMEEEIIEDENRFGKVIKDIQLKEIKPVALKNFEKGIREVKITKNDKTEYINRIEYWLKHPKRRRVKKIVFKPKGNVKPMEYNLWTNFADCVQNYIPMEQVDPKKFDLYTNHIKEILANGNKEIAQYIIKWMAFAVQFPEKIPEVAMILIGLQGTGKSLFVDMFGQMFGKHYMCLQSEEALTGRFNAHLANKVLVFADEALWKGDHKGINKLKNNITNPKINIEDKFKTMTAFDNYMHIIMASNNRQVLQIEPDDRRYFIIEMNDKWAKKLDETPEKKIQRKCYFDNMVKQFNEDGGLEHFYSFLMHFDLSDFDLKNFPDTDIKDEHKQKSIEKDVRGFLFNCLDMGMLYDHQDKWQFVSRNGFYESYCEYIKRHNPGWAEPLGTREFGKELRRLLPGCVNISTANIRVKDRDGYKYETDNVYRFDKLEACRKAFSKAVNININWSEPVDCRLSVPLPIEDPSELSYIDDSNEFDSGDGERVYKNIFERDCKRIRLSDGTTIEI